MQLIRGSNIACCRFEEAQCTDKAVQRTTETARADSSATREAACFAVGNLALAEVNGKLPKGSALGKLVPTIVALLSSDQVSDVQRIQLHVSPLPWRHSLLPFFHALYHS